VIGSLILGGVLLLAGPAAALGGLILSAWLALRAPGLGLVLSGVLALTLLGLWLRLGGM